MGSIRLIQCLKATDSDDFADCLARALMALPAGSLPLQGSCDQGGVVDDGDISASVMRVDPADDRIIARVGIFFTEIVGGCNCNDDPLQANAYRVLEVAIRRTDGVAVFTPLET